MLLIKNLSIVLLVSVFSLKLIDLTYGFIIKPVDDFEQSGIKRNLILRELSPNRRYFIVNSTFPRITKNSIINLIQKASYTLNVTDLSEWEKKDLKIKKKSTDKNIFCNIPGFIYLDFIKNSATTPPNGSEFTKFFVTPSSIVFFAKSKLSFRLFLKLDKYIAAPAFISTII